MLVPLDAPGWRATASRAPHVDNHERRRPGLQSSRRLDPRAPGSRLVVSTGDPCRAIMASMRFRD